MVYSLYRIYIIFFIFYFRKILESVLCVPTVETIENTGLLTELIMVQIQKKKAAPGVGSTRSGKGNHGTGPQ